MGFTHLAKTRRRSTYQTHPTYPTHSDLTDPPRPTHSDLPDLPDPPDLLDLQQLHVEHEHPVRGALAFVGDAFGDPESRPLAFVHQLQAFGPPGDHLVDLERRRFAAHDGAVEHLAVGRPSRVVHDHAAGRTRVPAADTLFQHFVGEAARGLLRVGRRRLYIRRRMARHINQLDVEDEHAFRFALALVGERLGNPEAALLAADHHLQPFTEPADDAVHTEGGRLAFADGAVEHRAVSLPAGVLDDDDVFFRGMVLAAAARDHFRRQTCRRLRRVGR